LISLFLQPKPEIYHPKKQKALKKKLFTNKTFLKTKPNGARALNTHKKQIKKKSSNRAQAFLNS